MPSTPVLAEVEGVVAIDSLSLREQLVPCHLCEALNQIVDAHMMGDSLAAAEQAAVRMVKFLPTSAWVRRATRRP